MSDGFPFPLDWIVGDVLQATSLPTLAVGDGVADDSAAFVKYREAHTVVSLLPEKKYRISQSCTIGAVLNLGGVLVADKGVIVTYEAVIGSPQVVCFSGLGAFRSSSNTYSVGHYEGNSLNDRWDFLRRALITNVPYSCHFYPPLSNEAAASTSKTGAVVWRLTAPIIIDDPENLAQLHQHCAWYADARMRAMIEYSPINKTENINWVLGLQLDGGNKAQHGEFAHGGARVHHQGYTAIARTLSDAIRIETDLWPFDELWYSFLDVVDFGGVGINIIGGRGSGAGTGIVLGGGIDYLFSNGGKLKHSAIYQLKGRIKDFRIGRIQENSHVPAGLGPPNDAIGLISNNEYGAPYDCYIGPMNADVAQCPALIVSDTTKGKGAKMRLTIAKQLSIRPQGIPLQLAWCDSLTILEQRRDRAVNTLMEFGPGVGYCSVAGVELYQIQGVWPAQLLLNGQYVYRSHLLDENAATIILPVSPSGMITLSTNFGPETAALILVQDGNLLPVKLGEKVRVEVGKLGGLDGLDGMINISIMNGVLYLENRLGSRYRVTLIASLA